VTIVVVGLGLAGTDQLVEANGLVDGDQPVDASGPVDANQPVDANGSVDADQPVEASGPPERLFGMTSHEAVVSEEPSVACPVVQVTIKGSGSASHLGKVTLTRTHCWDPDNTLPINDGQWQAVAANGDRVWGRYFGRLEPALFDEQGNVVRGAISSPYTLDGGTGQFEDATGEGIMTGDFDLLTGEADFLTEGFIWYGR
ncbi:MAG TPA: hypothetical protein VLC52_03230, partial [Anaerolineae bacterium]|nr:hypothetical protein [Anaerolineae bacterium]